MHLYPSTDPAASTLILAHGAGAGHDHPWMRRVAQGLADRGVSIVTFNFPYTKAGRKLPDRAPILEAAFVDVWSEVAASSQRRLFAGGKSMGGRIASQVAARHGFTPAPAGLVFFGYPLHPPAAALRASAGSRRSPGGDRPAKPAQWRDAHLPAIDVPMLFLSGTKDPFGSPEELRKLVERQNGRSALRPGSRQEGRPLPTFNLPLATLALLEGGDHSIVAGKRADPAGMLLERAMDIAAAWIQRAG
jgi:predicted alpha/beta-hydrolase family hydrolase